MIADILLIVIVLVALIIASVSDIKTSEVPDYASYSLVASALGIRLIYSVLSSDWRYFLYGLIGFGAMFAVGAGLYYTKQWGGGDAKLLMGLGAAFATSPFYISEKIPFLLSLLANLFIVGAVYGLIWSSIIIITHWNESFSEWKGSLKKRKKLHLLVVGFVCILAITSFFMAIFLRAAMIASAVFLAVYFYLYFFVKAAEKVGMHKRIKVSQLTEGDWVAEVIKVRGKVICSPKDIGLEKEQIAALLRAKVKSVLIKQGIRFVPAILIGVIISLIAGNIFLLFI